MKPRPEVLLVSALAVVGAVWLWSESHGPRGGRIPEPEVETAESSAISAPLSGVSSEPAELAERARPASAREESRAEPVEVAEHAPALALRGQLVDAATLEPIPEALVATSKRNDWTDANGWFDTGDALEELADIVVVNVGDDQSTHEVPRERWTKLASGWRIPVEIGPTFRLRFVGGEDVDARDWEARVCGADDLGSRWHSVRKGPPPYLRYDSPVHSNERWLEARSKDGLFQGRGEIESLVGIHEVDVALHECAVAVGRVVDVKGAPWKDVPIDAVHFSEVSVERFRLRTESDGSYQCAARDPGRMRILLMPPRGTRIRRLDVEVPRGLTRIPDLVVERRSTGFVRGVLRSRDENRPVQGTLRLRALDGSGYEVDRYFAFGAGRVITTGMQGDKTWDEYSSAQDRETFRFADVPRGRFELSATTKQGYACSPASIEVDSPADGLVFQFENAVELRPYYLELVDGETGNTIAEPVTEVWIAGSKSALDLGPRSDRRRAEMADGVRFQWIAFYPGYRMEHGTEHDFVLEDGAMVARRALRHGLGLRLEVRDYDLGPERWDRRAEIDPRWEASGVAGAEILADGVVVATSGEDGNAELDLPQVPERIDVRLPGWRTLDSLCFRDGKITCSLAATVWLVRE